MSAGEICPEHVEIQLRHGVCVDRVEVCLYVLSISTRTDMVIDWIPARVRFMYKIHSASYRTHRKVIDRFKQSQFNVVYIFHKVWHWRDVAVGISGATFSITGVGSSTRAAAEHSALEGMAHLMQNATIKTAQR